MFGFDGSGNDIIDLRHTRAEPEAKIKDWCMVIGLRQYTKNQGCIPYMGSHVLGKHGVVHCDILLKRPCDAVRCAKCAGNPETNPCSLCKPCSYQSGFMPGQSRMTPEEIQAERNRVHHDGRKAHVLTFTARSDGVVCCVDMLFGFNTFYRIDVPDEAAVRVERFFREQLRQPDEPSNYNCAGLWWNYIAQCRFCWPQGTYWIDVDADAERMTRRNWFCSEIVSSALAIAGAEGFSRETRGRLTQPCAVTPDNIAGIVLAHPGCYTEISATDVMLERQAGTDFDDDFEDDDELM